MKNQKILLLTQSALFAAMIYVVTYIHIPTGTGYLHVGDAFIYLAACILPTGWAMGAAAIGAGLSDATSGFPIWVIPTIIIKPLMVLMFTNKGRKILSKRTIIATVLAGIICVVGYYIGGGAILWFTSPDPSIMVSITAPLAEVGGTFIQAGASLIVFIAISTLLDKYNVKIKLQRGED